MSLLWKINNRVYYDFAASTLSEDLLDFVEYVCVCNFSVYIQQ